MSTRLTRVQEELLTAAGNTLLEETALCRIFCLNWYVEPWNPKMHTGLDWPQGKSSLGTPGWAWATAGRGCSLIRKLGLGLGMGRPLSIHPPGTPGCAWTWADRWVFTQNGVALAVGYTLTRNPGLAKA